MRIARIRTWNQQLSIHFTRKTDKRLIYETSISLNCRRTEHRAAYVEVSADLTAPVLQIAAYLAFPTPTNGGMPLSKAKLCIVVQKVTGIVEICQACGEMR